MIRFSEYSFLCKLLQVGVVWSILVLCSVHIPALAVIKAMPSASDSNRYKDNWFIYNLTPGETISDSLKIKNDALAPLTVGVSAYDYQPNQQGGFGLNLGEPREVGSWIGITSKVVSISPRDYIEVPFTVTVPLDTAEGQYAGGITAQVIEESMNQVAIELLQGTRVYITVRNPSQSPEASLKELPVGYKADSLELINPQAFDDENNQPYRNVLGRNRLAVRYRLSNSTKRFGQLVADLLVTTPSGKTERMRLSQEIPAGESSVEHFAFVEIPYEVGDYTLEIVYNLSDVLDGSPQVQPQTATSSNAPLLSGVIRDTFAIAREDLEDVEIAKENLFDQPVNLSGEIYTSRNQYGLILFSIVLIVLVAGASGYQYYQQRTKKKQNK